MKENLDMLEKIKRVGRLMGDRSVFRVCFDSSTETIVLLSADVVSEKAAKGIAKIPEYIG